ncbi:MAG: hypothetical protein CMJ80_10170 [Planctomycetaceae bacterium]|nr:hypothetical protein [Planctomycetaceae bacterium]
MDAKEMRDLQAWPMFSFGVETFVLFLGRGELGRRYTTSALDRWAPVDIWVETTWQRIVGRRLTLDKFVNPDTVVEFSCD